MKSLVGGLAAPIRLFFQASEITAEGQKRPCPTGAPPKAWPNGRRAAKGSGPKPLDRAVDVHSFDRAPFPRPRPDHPVRPPLSPPEFLRPTIRLSTCILLPIEGERPDDGPLHGRVVGTLAIASRPPY
jgi:hypothetical protein